MNCSQCGKQIPASLQHCPYCGITLVQRRWVVRGWVAATLVLIGLGTGIALSAVVGISALTERKPAAVPTALVAEAIRVSTPELPTVSPQATVLIPAAGAPAPTQTPLVAVRTVTQVRSQTPTLTASSTLEIPQAPLGPTMTRAVQNTRTPNAPIQTSTLTGEGFVFVGNDGNLWITDTNGKALRNIRVVNGAQFRPALSPNGQTIAVGSYPGILIVGIDGSGPRMAPGISGSIASDPSWSADANRVYFTYNATGSVGQDRIATVNADGTGLDVSKITGSFPVPSPNGNLLTYISPELGGLALTDMSGANGKRLVAESNGYPAWSPDGTLIAYSCDTKPVSICLVNLSGQQSRIPTGTLNAYGPTWSPDGTEIAFVAEGGLYVIHKDGTGLRKVTPDAAYPAFWARFVRDQ